jgi:hypothetical protein
MNRAEDGGVPPIHAVPAGAGLPNDLTSEAAGGPMLEEWELLRRWQAERKGPAEAGPLCWRWIFDYGM